MIWGLLPEIGPIFVGRGYLLGSAKHGYGYTYYRVREGSALWNSVRLYAVILWKWEEPPVFSKDLTINGHYPEWPSKKNITDKTVVYALQPDYALKAIPLSSEEADRASALLVAAERDNMLVPDDLWRTRIEPHLRFVGPEREGDVPTTKPSDVPAGTE
jgi:hypothetical protein